MMSSATFIVLALSGLGCSAFSLQHLRQFHFIDKAQTWPHAQKYCRRHYTDLATVNDVQDLEMLADLPGSEEQVPFVGLHQTWGWSSSGHDDYEGEVAYWNWASKPAQGQQACGVVGPTGQWAARNCNNKLNFICFSAAETDVGRRFVLVNGSSMTWLDAQAHCQEQYTGLATVQNQQETEVLQPMLAAAGGAVWFGLRLQSWVWSDGTQASFLPWKFEQYAKGEGDCGALQFGQSFHGLIKKNCDQKASFFCYSDPQRRHLVQLTLATPGCPVDARDPAVAASLLNQIQRRLEEKGASKDVKLSWRSFSKEEKKQESAEELKTCV